MLITFSFSTCPFLQFSLIDFFSMIQPKLSFPRKPFNLKPFLLFFHSLYFAVRKHASGYNRWSKSWLFLSSFAVCPLLICRWFMIEKRNFEMRWHFVIWNHSQGYLWETTKGLVAAGIEWGPAEQFGSRESGRVLRATLVFRGKFLIFNFPFLKFLFVLNRMLKFEVGSTSNQANEDVKTWLFPAFP